LIQLPTADDFALHHDVRSVRKALNGIGARAQWLDDVDAIYGEPVDVRFDGSIARLQTHDASADAPDDDIHASFVQSRYLTGSSEDRLRAQSRIVPKKSAV
jgi:hypothetical protein